MVCSCPDWGKRRSKFPRLDPRRLCRHLVQDFLENGAFAKDPEMEDLFYELEQFIEEFLIVDDEGEEGFDEEKDWAESYKGFPLGQLCRTNHGLILFNINRKWTYVIEGCCPSLYNYEEDRWAFGAEISVVNNKIYRDIIGKGYAGSSIDGLKVILPE